MVNIFPIISICKTAEDAVELLSIHDAYKLKYSLKWIREFESCSGFIAHHFRVRGTSGEFFLPALCVDDSAYKFFVPSLLLSHAAQAGYFDDFLSVPCLENLKLILDKANHRSLVSAVPYAYSSPLFGLSAPSFEAAAQCLSESASRLGNSSCAFLYLDKGNKGDRSQFSLTAAEFDVLNTVT